MAIRVFMAAVSLAAASTAAGDEAAFFKDRIEPILVGKCLGCHGADTKGGLDMRALTGLLKGGESGAAIVAGDADASLLLRRAVQGEMPPKTPLSDGEVAAIRHWIADGAFFPETPLDPFAATTETRAGYDWWAFQPVAAAEPPPVDLDRADWSVRAIDRFVWATLNENGLEPNSEADPVALIRRATYDLTGLPPTPDEIAAFVEACRAERGGGDGVSNAAYLALIDRLLASPAYGEHWGRHWLDVIRYGESTGYEVNAIIDNVWPFRDYVIRSFNDDKPFDRFIQEHLAGDALAPGDPAVEVGLTFLVAGPHDIVGNQDAVQAAQIRADTVDEMIRASTEAFLGLTVGCARCHDHKFDPISQADYYRFYATFAGVHHGARPIVTEKERAEREAALTPLVAKRDEANAAYAALEDTVLARAEERADVYEATWPRPPIARSLTEERFEPVEARYIRLVAEGRDSDVYARAGHRIDEFEVWRAADSVNVALAANGGKAEGRSRRAEDFAGAYQADAVNDGKYGETWLAEGPELTIAFPQPETIDRVTFSSDRPNALGASGEAVFLSEYRIEISMDGETWREIANSYDRKPVNDAHRRRRLLEGEMTEAEGTRLTMLNDERRAAQQAVDAVPRFTDYFIGNYRQPEGPTPIFLGGDPQRPAEEVAPASMTAASKSGAAYALAAGAPERERRLALANWITDPRNPLTARVLVNRVWHYHFGTGLVATPSDFGFMGAPPSHPELLDWLAREFVAPTWNPDFDDEGDPAWRLKRLHRLIMMSMTYRQSSAYREDAARIDADSRLLWRYPPRRLAGEAIRDTMLAVAGELDLTAGGPGFRLYRYLRDNVATYVPLDEHGPDTYRRAVYHQWVRAARIDLVTDFDSPDCALPAPRRDSTTSPLQALTLMNHDFTMVMSAALADRLRAEAGDEPAAQTARAFHLAFGRAPSAEETGAAAALIEAHGLRAFCRAILNANELIYLN